MKQYFKQPWHYFILLIVVTCIVYSNHFYNAFHFDDSHTIVNNLYIRSLKNIPMFFQDATTFSTLPANQAYRPVVTTSLAFDYWLGGGYNLFFFHLSTFLLFLLQGWLMLMLFKKIFDIAYSNAWNYYIALIAVAWYLLHPAMAETVNYVIARSDTQSTLMVILALFLYASSPFFRKTFLYLIPIAIGALAKPTAVMFAPILFFYILFFEKQLGIVDFFRKRHLKQSINSIVLTLPALITCAVLYWWIDLYTPKSWIPGGNSTFLYLITQPFVIAYYFGSLFLPIHLSADTDWKVLQSIWDVRLFIGILFIIAMLAVAVWTSKKAMTRPISFGILWFFLALVPSSSIIPLGEVMNDHRMFFPFVGLVMSVVWSVALLLMRYKVFYEKHLNTIVSVLGLVLVAYGIGTYQRNMVWRTNESLWHDVTVKSPDNARGLMNYGQAKMGVGDYETADEYFTKAIAKAPYYAILHINMGVLKEAQGDKVMAESYFKKALLHNDAIAESWFFYGRFLFNQKRYDEAIKLLLKTNEISPAYISSRELLMRTYDKLGDYEKLINLAENTLAIAPGNADALIFLKSAAKRQSRLSFELEQMKNNPSAEQYFQLSYQYYMISEYRQSIDLALEAIKLKPDYAEVYNNIGSAYNELREYENAIAFLKKAIAIKPDYTLAINNLALAEKRLAKQNIDKRQGL